MRKKDVPVVPNGFGGADSPYVGAVDWFDPLVGISGWVVSGGDPEETVRVEAAYEGEAIGSVLATAPRPDISKVLGREVLCGFQFKWTDFDADAVARLAESGDRPVRFLVGNRRYALLCVNGDIKLGQIAKSTTRQGKPNIRKSIAELKTSPFFDDEFYRSRAGIRGSRLDALTHYLDRGEAESINPSPQFDVKFYREVYGKFAKESVLLLDFIRQGKQERRYGTRQALDADVRKVKDSGLFDAEYYYDQQRGHFDPALTDIEQHLAYAWFHGTHANKDFDDRFYFHFHDDVKDSGLVPLVHFVERGRRDWRLTTDWDYRKTYKAVAESFDEDYYRIMNPELPPDCDLVKHYLSAGLREGRQPRRDFSPDFYWRLYPDLRNQEPFSHFLRWGREEGRAARANFAPIYRPGKKPYDPSKKSLLLVSHDGSRTGAPLVNYALGEALAGERNIVHVVLRDGSLVESLKKSSVAVAVCNPDLIHAQFLLAEMRSRWNIEAAILSSVETWVVAEAALAAGIPTVGLVHEFPEYSLPRGKVARMITAADFAVTPAKMVEEAAQQEVLRYAGSPCANNIRVHPQGYLGRLPDMDSGDVLDESEVYARIGATGAPRPRIVLGAGHVQIRKGVDLFVQTAAYVRDRCKEDVRFLWVGSGYQPDTDVAYSAWVRETVARLGLEDVVHFLPEQGNLDTLFGMCDIFYLPSRLDPFPNVVVDAAMFDKPVLAFKNATGVAELIESGDIEGRIVNYVDASAAADAIVDMLASPSRSGAHPHAAARDRFDFRAYTTFLEGLVAEAVASRRALSAAAERIEASGAFDADFYEGRTAVDRYDTRRALLDYVNRATKGVSVSTPRAGFHDGLYRSMHALDDSIIPLEHALKTAVDPTTAPTTHKVTFLDPDYARAFPAARVALHLHLHYSELAFDFEERLSALERDIDVFITTTSDDKALEARYAFAKYKRGTVSVMVVPNQGRDIGPFLTLLHEPIAAGAYDIVGHLHGKRTAHIKGHTGKRWRDYLLTNLCGSSANFDQIADLFMADDKLGLVFAEDRHLVGWSNNREIAEDLASRMRPRPRLPAFPNFPLGTMFWARPAALQPLWDLKLDWSDYPVEPLAEDGTILHAVERMLPSVCEAVGLDWRTVYRKGTGWSA